MTETTRRIALAYLANDRGIKADTQWLSVDKLKRKLDTMELASKLRLGKFSYNKGCVDAIKEIYREFFPSPEVSSLQVKVKKEVRRFENIKLEDYCRCNICKRLEAKKSIVGKLYSKKDEGVKR